MNSARRGERVPLHVVDVQREHVESEPLTAQLLVRAVPTAIDPLNISLSLSTLSLRSVFFSCDNVRKLYQSLQHTGAISTTLFLLTPIRSKHGDRPARQLPNSVLPEKYRLSLTPDLQNFTFDGQVDIDVNIDSLSQTSSSMPLSSPSTRQLLLRGEQPSRPALLPSMKKPKPLPSPWNRRPPPAPPPSLFPIEVPLTTSSRVSTAAATRTPRATSSTLQPPSLRPPTPVAPCPAGTSPPSKQHSRFP